MVHESSFILSPAWSSSKACSLSPQSLVGCALGSSTAVLLFGWLLTGLPAQLFVLTTPQSSHVHWETRAIFKLLLFIEEIEHAYFLYEIISTISMLQVTKDKTEVDSG